MPESALSFGDTRAPFGIVASGEDVWFTERNGDAIGHLDAARTLREYALPTRKAGPYGITLADDGTLWFTEAQADKLGHLEADGAIEIYAVPPS